MALRKQHKSAVALLLLAAVCAAILLSVRQKPQDEETGLLLADEASRTAWLELRGWQVGTPTVTQIQIPQTWETQQGQSWLRLQAAQDLHPERYGGCTASRYLYPVTGTESEYLYAELILCGDVLIGAQVYDAATRLMQSVI